MAHQISLGDVTNVINHESDLRHKRPRAGSTETSLVEGRNIDAGHHGIIMI
jgi:hypothetical protein